MTYRKAELLFSLTSFFLGSALFLHTFDSSYEMMSQELSMGPTFFPRIVLGVWMLCSADIFVEALRNQDPLPSFLWGRVLIALALFALFIGLFGKIGFILSGFIFFISLSYFMGYRKIVTLVCVAAAYIAVMQILFTKVLNFILPGFGG